MAVIEWLRIARVLVASVAVPAFRVRAPSLVVPS